MAATADRRPALTRRQTGLLTAIVTGVVVLLVTQWITHDGASIQPVNVATAALAGLAAAAGGGVFELRLNRWRLHGSLLSVLLFVLAFGVWVIDQGRSGQVEPLTGTSIGLALTISITLGALYAMYATGLVVVYTTTGIFNFAQGAIGVFAAYLYWQLRFDWGWHPLISLFLVVGIAAPLLGVLLDVTLMRRLQNAPLVLQLMVTVGLMVLLLSIVGQIWRADVTRSFPAFYGQQNVSVGGTSITYHRLIVAGTAIALVIGLRLLFRSALGIAMRAVVDNRDLAALTGIRPSVVSALAWAIGTMLGALGGILIAPELGALESDRLNIIIIWAFAAAAFGQLRSLPLTLVGALVLGLLRQFTNQFLSFGNEWNQAHEAVTALVLFAVVIALPRAPLEVGRATSQLKRIERTTRTWEAALGGIAVMIVALALADGWLNFGIWDPGSWDSIALNRANSGIGTVLIAMSLVPLTGWAGQINLAPLAFAGFGGVIYLHLAGDESGSVLIVILAGLLTAPLGALVAIPVARLRGLYLALASMAFAQGMVLLVFQHPRIVPPTGAGIVPPVDLFGYVLDDRRAFFLFNVAVFAIFMVLLTILRNSRWGRLWVALSDSPAAAATVGTNVQLTKIVVYALSAAMAGSGGALLFVIEQADARQLTLVRGLTIVLLIAVAGISYPIAAIFGAFLLMNEALLQRFETLGNVPDLVWLQGKVGAFGVGTAAIGLVINQRGAAHRIGSQFARFLPWREDAREQYAAEKQADRVPEYGELGLERAFTPVDIVKLDRELGVLDDVIPPAGYRRNDLVLPEHEQLSEVDADGNAAS